jgi:hypothetical protein
MIASQNPCLRHILVQHVTPAMSPLAPHQPQNHAATAYLAGSVTSLSCSPKFRTMGIRISPCIRTKTSDHPPVKGSRYMDRLKASLLAQLDAALNFYQVNIAGGQASSRAQIEANSGEFSSSAIAAVERAVGTKSPFYSEAARYAEQNAKISSTMVPELGLAHIHKLAGVVRAVRSAVANDYLASAREMIRGEVFADFLAQAEYLLDQGYKDPAAVIAGGVIEDHLRRLCEKLSIETTELVGADVRPKKAEKMNTDLVKADAYEKLQQKNITAWLDLRNKAAHGEYDKYATQEVKLMLAGITDFISRFPA